VYITEAAQQDMMRLPRGDAKRIDKRIQALASNPRPRGSKKLKGTESSYRIRSGDFRALYVVNDGDKTVVVARVKDRKDAYD
jgi:mRNA interferase RelE/StbE